MAKSTQLIQKIPQGRSDVSIGFEALRCYNNVAAMVVILFLLSSCKENDGGNILNSNRWESDIQAFEAYDNQVPPAEGSVLFIGSSSIMNWKTLSDDMNPVPVINRGFGGSTMSDLNYYRDRIIKNHKPKIVVVYEGDNDIAAGVSIEALIAEYENFIDYMEEEHSTVEICFISIKPSPKRIDYWPSMKTANFQLKKLIDIDSDRLCYLNIANAMLDEYGEPNKKLFLSDELHLNRQGYVIWSDVIRPKILSIYAD